MKTGIIQITKKGVITLGIAGFFASLATAQAAYFNPAPIARCETQITSQLSRGSEGPQVFALQNLLSQGGYMYAVPNGYYGPATTAGVRNFQLDNAIYPTGNVGPMTINALNERFCDNDVRGDALSLYGYYGGYDNYTATYATGVTYVDKFDAYVQVVSPAPSNPSVYATPPTTVPVIPNVAQLQIPTGIIAPNGQQITYNNTPVTPTNYTSTLATSVPIIPATSSVGVQSTNIIYSPQIGYTYGITPTPGVLTITTPTQNASFNEGDTVNIAWSTSNLSATQYQILLENTSSNQSKLITTVSGNSASFVLTKEVLDAVCAGICSQNNYYNNFRGTFRIVVATPVRDIAGNVSNFRAAVSPVFITRPPSFFSTVSLTTSKTPVNNGELFKLYVNIPTGASWNSNIYGQYSFKIRANCPAGVTTSIAGVACGQDFALPFSPSSLQQEIPVMVGNSTWYRQDVTFTLTVTNLQGQIIGTDDTVVQVNGSPFNW